MKILVTGGAGFIGSNLALELERLGHRVTVFDNFSTGTLANLDGFGGSTITGELPDLSLQKLSAMAPDAIFHQGAITDTTVHDERLMLSVNLAPMKTLLEYTAERKTPLVYASSAAVYGAAPSPQREDSAGKPLNIYGVSKWKCDCLVTEFLKFHPDAHVVGLRYFNVFGPREQNKGKMASMVCQLASQIMSGKNPRIFKWGDQKRDFVYVKDIVRANLLALEKGKSGIYNAGSGKARSFNDVCAVLFKSLGKTGTVEYFNNPYTGLYQDHTEASLERSSAELGYIPAWTLERAVEDYMAYLKQGAKKT
jgi:ADP-L-glycero-D-manno-heptose 6-epimerase